MSGWREVGPGSVALVVMVLIATGCTQVLTPQPPTPTPTPPAAEALATPTLAPESYLTPLPPTPTFTPTPTPTPVIHVVESGDTLFGIALEYGVSPEAIQRANGLDDPQYLRVGQALIIPIGTEEAEAQPGYAPADVLILPTPTPLPLEAAHLRLHPTAVGGLWCMGEIVNTQEVPVTNLQLEVMLVDGGGHPLVAEGTMAAADYLEPGKAAPFALLFPQPPDGAQDCRVRLLRAEPIGTITAALEPLEVVGAEGRMAGPQYLVEGSLVNHSGRSLSKLRVVVTLYDEEGGVLTYREAAFPDDRILPDGVAMPFEVYLTPLGGHEPASFAVLAWGTATP